MHHPTIAIDGVDIYYREARAPHAKPQLLAICGSNDPFLDNGHSPSQPTAGK